MVNRTHGWRNRGHLEVESDFSRCGDLPLKPLQFLLSIDHFHK